MSHVSSRSGEAGCKLLCLVTERRHRTRCCNNYLFVTTIPRCKTEHAITTFIYLLQQQYLAVSCEGRRQRRDQPALCSTSTAPSLPDHTRCRITAAAIQTEKEWEK